MKYLYTILFVLIYSLSFSQQWRDTLDDARKAYKQKEYPKALKLYRKAQKIAPKAIDLSNEIAQSAYKSKSFADAEKIYTKPTNGKLGKLKNAQKFHNIGNSRMKQQNYQGAIESYKTSLRNNPYDSQTRYNLSEAIRKLKKKQNKDNPKSNPKPQNQPKGNPKSKNQPENKSPNNSPNQKLVDRMLDKLSKQESATKQKLSGKNKGEKGQATTGKDW